MIYIVEWSSEFSDERQLAGVYSTRALAETNVPAGRWLIYEAEIDGGSPKVVAITPGWDG